MSTINRIQKRLKQESERKRKARMQAIQSKLVDRINTASQEFKFDPKPFVQIIERDIGKLKSLEKDLKNNKYRVVVTENEGKYSKDHCIIRVGISKSTIHYEFQLSILNDIFITKVESVEWLF